MKANDFMYKNDAGKDVCGAAGECEKKSVKNNPSMIEYK